MKDFMSGGLRNNFVGKAFYTGVGFHEKTLDNITEPINTEQVNRSSANH